MTKKEIISLVVAGVVVIGIIVLGVAGKLGGAEEPITVPGGTTGETTGGETGEGEIYTPEIPQDAVLTTPVEEIPVIDPGTGEQKGRVGVFAITATKNGYDPETVTVKLGDVVNLELTAQGGAYDIYSPYLGFYLSAQDGETKQLSFKASLTGAFSFECRDRCPVGKKISGKLVILPN